MGAVWNGALTLSLTKVLLLLCIVLRLSWLGWVGDGERIGLKQFALLHYIRYSMTVLLSQLYGVCTGNNSVLLVSDFVGERLVKRVS